MIIQFHPHWSQNLHNSSVYQVASTARTSKAGPLQTPGKATQSEALLRWTMHRSASSALLPRWKELRPEVLPC